MLTEHLKKLLDARGIEAETASRLGWTGCDRGPNWLAIPIHRNGKLVNTKYRTLAGEKQFSQEKGGERCFFNVDALRNAKVEPVVITEGEMDCAIAIQCGFLAVSVPDGAPAEAIGDRDTPKYEYLSDLPSAVPVILCTDADNPGANLFQDLVVRIGKARCKWVKYPKGCKDLNDAFARYGKRGVVETIGRAQFMEVGDVFRMSELPPAPSHATHPCGIEGMSDHYRIRPGDLCVVTGIPSHGKTTLVNEIGARYARDMGWMVAYASFEQNPRVDHLRYLRTFHGSRPEHLQSEGQIAEADRWIDEKFRFIVPNGKEDADLPWLLEKCRAAVVQHDCRIIVIDPWNEMDHIKPSELTLTEYTGLAIRKLKEFAKQYQAHVIVVAHPAKLKKDKDGMWPVPSLYDISDSSHWYNKPDIGIVVHKEADHTMVRVAKCRYFNVIGKPGDLKLRFDDYRNRFQFLGAA